MPPDEKPHGGPPAAPTVLAMVLCNRVLNDSDTRRPSLQECFSDLAADAFPAALPGFSVHVILTHGEGVVPLGLRLVNGDPQQPLISIAAPVEFRDPQATRELTFTIPGITVPAPGDYRIELRAGDQLLMERRLAVAQDPGPAVTREAPPQGGDERPDDEGWVLAEGAAGDRTSMRSETPPGAACHHLPVAPETPGDGTLTDGDDLPAGGDGMSEAQPLGCSSIHPTVEIDARGVLLPGLPGYEILSELGRGGMGVVYKARQKSLNRLVAVKMILARDLGGDQELARFRSEAEAASRSSHAGIVHIYDVGEHNGHPYFSMEFVEGGNLSKKLAGGPLPASEAARLIEALARAIDAAHQQGIVHRDLKPANVLLTADGQPKITDFGVAKLLDSDAGLTQTGWVLGSPNYMAPEQADGQNRQVGPLADVFALGAMLYEMLTGRPPFQAASVWDTLHQVKYQEPVTPGRLQPNVPSDLETICLKCLQKEPDRRYSSGQMLAEDLQRFLTGESILARPVGQAERLGRWGRHHPAVAGLLLGLVAVMASSLAAVTVQWRKTEEARAAVAQAAYSHEFLERLERVISVLKDAETGQRGYVITGKEAYLEPYNQALADFDQALMNLRGLIGNDVGRQRRLDAVESLAVVKLRFLREVVDLRRREGLEAAVELIKTDRGKKVMGEIRKIIAEMEAEERLSLRSLEMGFSDPRIRPLDRRLLPHLLPA